MPTPLVRYGLACLAAERFRLDATGDAATLETHGFWVNLLGALKSPDAWERTEPMFASVRRSAAGPELARLLMRAQCRLDLARLGAIGARGARKLEGEFIWTYDALLRRATDPADRAALAKRIDEDPATVEGWAQMAEAAVVLAIAPAGYQGREFDLGDFVTLASLAAIRNVGDLARSNVAVVAAGMEASNTTEGITMPFTAQEVVPLIDLWKGAATRWIEQIGREGATSMVRPSPAAAPTENKECSCSPAKPEPAAESTSSPAETS